MTIRTPIVTFAFAFALAASMAANAAHVNRHKSAVVRTSPSATLNTSANSYIQTSTSPNTYINVNACQITGLCTGLLDPSGAAT